MLNELFRKVITSKSKTFQAFCFCILLVAAVVTWGAEPPLCVSGQELCSYYDRVVTVAGTIVDQPERQLGQTRYVVEATSIESWGEVEGRMLLTTKNYPVLNNGDVVRVECKLSRPDDESWKYLALKKIFVQCGFPKKVEKTGEDRSMFYYVFALREFLEKQVGKLWGEPEASLMAGILYGSRSGLPQELKSNFSKTALSHIVAVSGFNITILAAIMMRICIWCGAWRRQAFWIVIFFLVLFVIFTGASASVVRAGCMGILVLLGEYIGRPTRIGSALLFAATVMVCSEPMILLYDIGFQLSFAATAGLVYVSERMQNMLPFKDIFPAITEMFGATLAAQIATLPLIMYHFGQVSLIAPLTNMLVVWLIPWLMLFGALAVMASCISLYLGQVIAWPAYLGLAYIIQLVTWFGKQSWSSIIIWEKIK